MRFEKLSEYNIKNISSKKIVCYEKSESYLREMCGKYDILGQISCIVDSNARNHGLFELLGKAVEVRDAGALEHIDFENTVLVITSDYYWEAYDYLSSLDYIARNAEVIYYYENYETETELCYRRKYERAPLENIIIFRSGPHSSAYVKGMDFGDNARALFEYMLSAGYNENYQLVWLVKDPGEYDRYKGIDNVAFLSYDWSISPAQAERDAYYHALCLAKYIFMTDAYGFARNCRYDQVRVQLWHGCGFKTRVNFVRCEKRYEYMTVISEVYSKIHQDIYGLRKDQMLVTGYAKQDWLFENLSEDRWQQLGVPDGCRYVFWLPTFREAAKSLTQLNEQRERTETGLPVADTADKLSYLNELLKARRMALIIKLHPFQDRKVIDCGDFSHIILLDNDQLAELDIQTNQLLGRAAALISDYSSVAVDYMLLDRPIAFTLDDVEEYHSSRGFIFENVMDWMPGKSIYFFDQFCGFLEEIAEGKDSAKDKRRSLADKMHKYHDGNNCKRIVEALGI